MVVARRVWIITGGGSWVAVWRRRLALFLLVTVTGRQIFWYPPPGCGKRFLLWSGFPPMKPSEDTKNFRR